MHATEAVKNALTSTQQMLQWYLNDLSDADLEVRPVPAANHIAWQLGHLIASEVMIGGVAGFPYPELPAGLKTQSQGESSKTPPPGGYLKKAEYVDWFNKVRGATIAGVERMSDADLDKPTPGDFAQWAPTLGTLLILTANHTLMHAGQFSVVRRALNKPVLF